MESHGCNIIGVSIIARDRFVIVAIDVEDLDVWVATCMMFHYY
jgi:hypothetical protein